MIIFIVVSIIITAFTFSFTFTFETSTMIDPTDRFLTFFLDQPFNQIQIHIITWFSPSSTSSISFSRSIRYLLDVIKFY